MKFGDGIAIAIIVLIMLILIFAISGLIYWGIGAFIVHVFQIDYAWTYWHGLALSFITWILGGIFSTKNFKIGE